MTAPKLIRESKATPQSVTSGNYIQAQVLGQGELRFVQNHVSGAMRVKAYLQSCQWENGN